jgi:hypothetical protein
LHMGCASSVCRWEVPEHQQEVKHYQGEGCAGAAYNTQIARATGVECAVSQPLACAATFRDPAQVTMYDWV